MSVPPGLWAGLVGPRENVLCPCLTDPPSKLAIRIKKPIKTKFRLPVFNWTALKPNQISGTVFSELDDEKILEVAGPGALGGKLGAGNHVVLLARSPGLRKALRLSPP